MNPLIKIGLLRDMSLVPLIPNPPKDVAAFEEFAYQVFATDNGYSPKSGISQFGKGIYSKYANGTHYHDTTGKTSFSKNNILCPVLAFGNNFINMGALMFNIHSEVKRGTALDQLIAEFNEGRRNASTVTKLLQLVQDTNGLRPASLMMYPITPALNSTTLVGFVSIIQNWDTVLTEAIPSNAQGIDFVLSDGSQTFTYTIPQGGGMVQLIGAGGDFHDPAYNSYRRTYSSFSNSGYSAYTVTYYPNSSYFPYFLKVGPVLGCILTIVLILLMAGLFALYNYYKDGQLQHQRDALESKRVFVRFISHEIRTPMNTVCLGLRLLQNEAKKAVSEAEIDLEIGPFDTSSSETSPLLATEMEKSKHTNNPIGNESLGANLIDTTSSQLIESTRVKKTSIDFDNILVANGASESLVVNKPMRTAVALAKKICDWTELMRDVDESAHNAVEVLNELMSYDKIEMKTLKIEMELLPISHLVLSTVQPFFIQAKEKCIEIELHIPPAGPIERFVIGDSVRLAQVVRNLISNALKFSGPNTVVRVTLTWLPESLHKEGNLTQTISFSFVRL